MVDRVRISILLQHVNLSILQFLRDDPVAQLERTDPAPRIIVYFSFDMYLLLVNDIVTKQWTQYVYTRKIILFEGIYYFFV